MSSLQKDHRRARKNFLIAFWVFHSVTSLICLLVDSEQFLSDAIAMSMWAIPTYYFAYRKQGTSFLFFVLLFLIPYNFAHETGLLDFQKFLSDSTIYLQHPKVILYLVLKTALNFYYWVSCFSLYKLNRQLKFKKTAGESLGKR